MHFIYASEQLGIKGMRLYILQINNFSININVLYMFVCFLKIKTHFICIYNSHPYTNNNINMTYCVFFIIVVCFV